ncbi:MAG: FMN-binding negative transcriptional regulator [Acidobacteriota bacterium]|nr:FMN-binding negative transcriptional regulator [Acidobacteriota bacterium]MDE3043596.1 FMN-binding negative transcriptional regulator [Acidobacteriota bacterium]MDE3107750.1 FMN-binding negative transcriptional regulator [Acidobacteriota bacterium]MDE3222602.1 FMN-binding negative transcriptional regulator [Acidobacteriota bacterium]
MLINASDAALSEAEWREWLLTTDHFGVLAVNNLDAAHAPMMVPTHFTLLANELLLHLATPNPVWPHLEVAREVGLIVTGDYAYIPTYWRAPHGTVEEDGVPTSYYAAVQFLCRPSVVDDSREKAELLGDQLGGFQPEGRHAEVRADGGPYARMLPGIRGLRLEVLRVDAKFKYDDSKSVEHREKVIRYLEQRDRGVDRGAARQQRRRLNEIGDWRHFRENS